MNTSTPDKATLAETLEKMRLILVWLFFFIGISELRQALAYELPEAAATMLIVFKVVTVIAIFACIFMFFSQWVKARKQGCHYRTIMEEAFIERALYKAMATAFMITLVLVIFLVEWYEPEVLFFGSHDLAELNPARFYFLLISSVMCLTYSLSFFRYYYLDNSED